MRKYYDEINIARGIALIAVLAGHSFPDAQTGMSSPAAQWIVMAMYSFHMGLFFFLSGFVAGSKLCVGEIKLGHEVIKKWKRIIVPYLFYSVITLGLKQVFSAFANNQFDVAEIYMIFIGKNPNGGMWYLWALFIVSLIFLLSRKVGMRWKGCLAVGAVLYIMGLVVPSTFMDSVLEYSIYYACGIAVQQNDTTIRGFFVRTFGKRMAVIALAAFVVLISFFEVPYLVTCILATIFVMALALELSRNRGGGYRTGF